MEQIGLDELSQQLALLCVPALRELCELLQKALDTLVSDSLDGDAPQAQDLASLPETPETPEFLRYMSAVMLPVTTHMNSMMDNGLAAANLIDLAHHPQYRTAMGPVVLSRAVLEVALTLEYRLAGPCLAHRLVAAYASTLGDYHDALGARSLPGPDPSVTALEDEYRDLCAAADSYGYSLERKGRFTVAGQKAVTKVRDTVHDIEAEVNVNISRAARSAGDLWLYHWKFGSGVTHGRLWAVQGEYQRASAGEAAGGLYLSAATIIFQAARTAIDAITTYTGHPGPAQEFFDLHAEFVRELEKMGLIPAEE